MKPILFAASAALLCSVAQAEEPARPGMEQGRAASALLFAGKSHELLPKLSPEFLKALNGKAGMDAFAAAIAGQAGKEVELFEEHVFNEAGMTSYYRRSRFERLPDVTTLWVFDKAGVIHGGSVRPTQQPAPTPHLDYTTRTPLRLPFTAQRDGRWYVAWGGRDLIHNYHAASKDQRFAYDLFVVKGDSPFRTDGTTNEDHYCFGEPILAPASGKVVAAVDGLADNVPGRMDEANPGGNHVVIDHGEGEYSFLAHLQNGSVRAKPGETVEGGAEIGKCGNSGRTAMPHLHYHLQTTPTFFQGDGLPAKFNAYRADGRPVDRGEPSRGQSLEP